MKELLERISKLEDELMAAKSWLTNEGPKDGKAYTLQEDDTWLSRQKVNADIVKAKLEAAGAILVPAKPFQNLNDQFDSKQLDAYTCELRAKGAPAKPYDGPRPEEWFKAQDALTECAVDNKIQLHFNGTAHRIAPKSVGTIKSLGDEPSNVLFGVDLSEPIPPGTTFDVTGIGLMELKRKASAFDALCELMKNILEPILAGTTFDVKVAESIERKSKAEAFEAMRHAVQGGK